MPKPRGQIERIEGLRAEMEALGKTLQRQARRPFVLEITGTPKAGKTTLITLLDGFLRQCGWKVHVLAERAGECQLPMKGHFFFNTWTTGTMLAGLLDAIDRDLDIIILDRGLFDALVWLRLQASQRQVSGVEASTFENFVLLDRWRMLTDTTLVLETSPETAMARETARRLLPRRGSVMNQGRLREFNGVLREARRRHGQSFKILEVRNDGDAPAGAIKLVQALAKQARAWADPEIAVVPVMAAEELLKETATGWTSSLWQKIASSVSYRRRSTVEEDDNWVQLLACGTQVYGNEVFLSIRRRERGRAPSSRDDTGRVWQGCHVEKSQRTLTRAELAAQLRKRLQTDLHLGDLRSKPHPLGFIWTPNGKETRHLGIMFKVPLEARVADFLDEKEFRTNGRGHTLKSSFVSRNELTPDKVRAARYALEDWSLELLAKNWVP